VPITGTSANISGKSPCRSADEVVEALGGRVDLVLDGGKTEGTIGSTILDVTVDPPLILRRGLVEPDF
jgi:L-threonylcarbamoyladenylate synthase